MGGGKKVTGAFKDFKHLLDHILPERYVGT
jgi:hypothetical protein